MSKKSTLKAGLPRGRVSVKATHGGLDITNPDSGEVTVIATAAVEAFLDAETVRTTCQSARADV